MPVILRGGLMDGWVVPIDAPVMRPDWYKTIPRPTRRTLLDIILRRPVKPTPPGRPGRYVLAADGKTATWTEGSDG